LASRMASRSPDEFKALREAQQARLAVFRALQDLREKHTDPAHPAVQALIVQLNESAVHHGLRDFRAALLEWNPSIARKWVAAANSALSRNEPPESSMLNSDLRAYVRAAREASPWHLPVRHLTDEATTLVEQKVDPSSASAQKLARRLAEICADHSLGDPVVYAHSAALPIPDSSAEANARRMDAWMYLVSVLRVAA
jgi:hypothetical protein